MKRALLLVILSLLPVYYSLAKEYKVASPDNKISLTVNVGTDIKFTATCDGKEIINDSKIALVLANGKVLGENEKVRKAAVTSFNDIIIPVVANKKSEIKDNCNILIITFSSGFSLQFRAYNDGVSYRFETGMKEEITVKNEISELIFPAGSHAWYPRETSFMSHNERTFIYSSLDTITN